ASRRGAPPVAGVRSSPPEAGGVGAEPVPQRTDVFVGLRRVVEPIREECSETAITRRRYLGGFIELDQATEENGHVDFRSLHPGIQGLDEVDIGVARLPQSQLG